MSVRIKSQTFGRELQRSLSRLRKSKVLDVPLLPQDGGAFGEFPETVDVLLSEMRHRRATPALFLAVAQAFRPGGGNVRLRGNHVVKQGRILFVPGNLDVEGHLDVVGTLVVSGSTTVRGVLTDCGPNSLVAIGGNLSVGHVHTDGEMLVGGTIQADGLVYGVHNDNSLIVEGAIRARLLIEDEHDVRAGKGVRAAHHFDIDRYQQGNGRGVQEALRRILVPEVFRKERSFRFELLSTGPNKEALFKSLVRKCGYPLPYLKERRPPIDLMQYGNVTPKSIDSVRETIERAGGRCALGTDETLTLETERLFKRAKRGDAVFLS